MTAEKGFEPKIIGFLCNWCSYAGADKAGGMQQPYPHNVQVIRVMCSGRVDPQFILSALAKGADGVIILACHPGDCHYKEGNCRALQRHSMLNLMLEQLGIEKERCRLDYVSAGEEIRYGCFSTRCSWAQMPATHTQDHGPVDQDETG